jgi:hypothetical protein
MNGRFFLRSLSFSHIFSFEVDLVTKKFNGINIIIHRFCFPPDVGQIKSRPEPQTFCMGCQQLVLWRSSDYTVSKWPIEDGNIFSQPLIDIDGTFGTGIQKQQTEKVTVLFFIGRHLNRKPKRDEKQPFCLNWVAEHE